ncbi:NrdH-like glutaredoxin [Microbacterium phage Roman]|nr:NrdH-like glutaredoxin [Microbacterium phage Roman]
MKIKLYTTPTCGTCKMAGRRLDSAGADVEIVDLTEHPDLLAELKSRLNKGVSEQIQVPLFEDENDEIFDITGLSGLVARVKQ